MADTVACRSLWYCLLLFDAVYLLYVVYEHYNVIFLENK